MKPKKMLDAEVRYVLMTPPHFMIKRGSCDATGKRNYRRARQTHPDHSVVALQTLLITAGYLDDVPDGLIGKKGDDAIRRFLASHNLGVDEFSPPAHTPTLYEDAIQRGQVQVDHLIEDVPYFSQVDPRWAQRTLTTRTFAQVGCAVCGVAMALAYYFRDNPIAQTFTPKVLDEHLDETGGYVGNAIVWGEVARYARRYGVRVVYRRERAPSILKIKELLDQNTPVLLRVDYASDSDGNYNHFVLGVGHTGDDILFHDPASIDGSAYLVPDNTLAKCRRQGGYQLVGFDYFEIVP